MVLTEQGPLSRYISKFDDTVTEVKLPNLLFTIATGYPSTSKGTCPLTDKEQKMFSSIIPVSCNKTEFLAYIADKYDRRIKRHQENGEKESVEEEQKIKDLLVKILTSDDFDFSDEDYYLNYSSLVKAAESSEGDAMEFLEGIKRYNVIEKTVDMLSRILGK